MESSPSCDAAVVRPLVDRSYADAGGGDLPGHLSIDMAPAWDNRDPLSVQGSSLRCLFLIWNLLQIVCDSLLKVVSCMGLSNGILFYSSG